MPSRALAVLLASLFALGSVPSQAAGIVTSVGAAGESAASGSAGAVVTGQGRALSIPTVSLTASLIPSVQVVVSPALKGLPATAPFAAEAARSAAPLAVSPEAAARAAIGVPAALSASYAAPNDGPRQDGTPGARESLDAAGQDAAAPKGEEGLEAGKTRADARFDGADKKSTLEDSSPVRGGWGRRTWLGLAATAALGVGLVTHTGPSNAVPVPNVAASDVAAQASSGLLHGLGQVGYIAGNTLAFIFPVFEIYRVYQTGTAEKTPLVRSLMLIGAYVAVGMFVLTLSGLPLWAIQNLFGAATLAAVWPSAWVAKRFSTKTDKKFSLKAVLFTALSTAVAGGLSVGLYYLVAAPFIPGLVMGLFGAAAIGGITLGIQIAAAAVQAMLFAPDLIKLWKGKVGGEGFSEGFTIALMLASLGFVLYSVVRALAEPFGTTTMWQMVLYAALYTLYTVSSGATWWLGRKNKARKL